MTRLIPPVIEAGAMSGHQQPDISIDDDLKLRPWQHGDAQDLIDAFSGADITSEIQPLEVELECTDSNPICVTHNQTVLRFALTASCKHLALWSSQD